MAGWLRYSKKRLVIVLAVLSLATAVIGQRPASWLRHVMHVLLAPLGDGGMYAVTSLKSYAGSRAAPALSSAQAQALIQENEALRQQLEALERQWADDYATYQRRLEEIQGIRKSFGPHEDIPCELIPARVIAADSMPYRQGRVLNQGASRGVAAGAPVLARLLMTDRSKEMPPQLAVVTASALVGRLDWAGPFTARVQLLTDPGFTLRARIVRRIDPSRPRWIKVLRRDKAADEPLTKENNLPVTVLASGDGLGGMVAEAAENEKIEPGDWLMTSDDDPHLRVQIRVGVVEEVGAKPEDHRFVKVRVRPLVDLSALRDVYIVYWNPP